MTQIRTDWTRDEIAALTLPVESAMHVSIVGDDSMPQWSFTGEGSAFTVAVHAYLNLAYVTMPGGRVSLMRGGEVSLDHVQMQRTQLHVAGSLAVSNSPHSMLAGRSKSGKSMMALGLALAVSNGGRAFSSSDYRCEMGSVFFAALEDSPRRLQSRTAQLMESVGGNAGSLFRWLVDLPRLD